MKLRLLFLVLLSIGLAGVAGAGDEDRDGTASGEDIGERGGSTTGVEIAVEPELSPAQEELLRLRQELGRMVAAGEITEEEAEDRWAAAVEELDLDSGRGEVVILPAPEPFPEPGPNPVDEELRALREDLARQVEEGLMTWEEAVAIFEEVAASLRPEDGVEILLPVDEEDGASGSSVDEDAEQLLEDFRRELALQIEDGLLSPDEAEQQMLDFMLALGLIKEIDGGGGRPVGPTEDPDRPHDADRERMHKVLDIFNLAMEFLVAQGVLTPEQLGHQFMAFMEVLENGEELSEPPPEGTVTSDQAEIIYLARELAHGYEGDEIDWEQIQEELIAAANELDLIGKNGGIVIIVPDDRPDVDRVEERLEHFRQDLDELVQSGELTPEQAEERWLQALAELGLIDRDLDGEDPDDRDPGGEDLDGEDRPDRELSPEEEKYHRLRRELAAQVEDGRLTVEEAREQLRRVAADLGLVNVAGEIVVDLPPLVRPPLPPEYVPSSAEEAMIELLGELTALVENGELTEEEAWGRLTAAAEELDWVDEGETFVGGGDTAVEPAGPEE